jgi:hypothetical protein
MIHSEKKLWAAIPSTSKFSHAFIFVASGILSIGSLRAQGDIVADPGAVQQGGTTPTYIPPTSSGFIHASTTRDSIPPIRRSKLSG